MRHWPGPDDRSDERGFRIEFAVLMALAVFAVGAILLLWA